jgi:8-oxo-dGTP pyrophosphatase MutT (NUDIX family)
MPMSDYYKSLRDKVGHDLLLMPAVAAVIHDADGRVLMMRHHADGNWSLPAGAIEPGEAPTDALVREVAEETGLEVVPTKILGVFGGRYYRVTYPNGDKVEYTVTAFAADVRSGELHAPDGEALEFGWFDPHDPPSMGVYYPREVLAKTPLGPPPNVERIAADFDLPRDARSWSSIPMGICSTCALRTDGNHVLRRSPVHAALPNLSRPHRRANGARARRSKRAGSPRSPGCGGEAPCLLRPPPPHAVRRARHLPHGGGAPRLVAAFVVQETKKDPGLGRFGRSWRR